MESIIDFFTGKGYMPHGHCYLWKPGILWLNISSDALIALAYMTIPITLIYFIRKRQDVPFNWMFMSFGVFILACGATHVMNIWVTWYPAYWLIGGVKAVTAAASVITALLLVKLIPAALSIPSQAQLSRINQELQRSNEELMATNRMLEETQRQLMQREKMAALGRLVAGVAHEINTPIGVIVTASTLLTEETERLHKTYASESLSEEELTDYIDAARDSTRLIAANAGRAANLIQSFKQVAVDQSAGEERRFNLSQYLHEIVTSLSPALKKASSSVSIHGPQELEVYSHPGALSQVLTNLILNSLTHGFAGGPGIVDIRFDVVDDQVELLVCDNGVGIPESLRDKVFEPFFTSKRNEGGSGLGLHILHNLVTNVLNGKVRIADTGAEQGVAFAIEFPRDGGDKRRHDGDFTA
ncbi:sensor histidine kinase [Hahella sp. HN01]|uniref:sensor histidine kinase n=1 Tax=Hahella sp. HN01 TaxID=2847262 RepID=UPI001C1EE5B4|nr:HAMP domain-containing sensor histidine kinase [Hahella sp. HN01]MBU6951310.1 HAMP domain-containing histidine kinase [Hahella sp. HN01]